MSETSKRKKYLMWYKVKELVSKNLKKTQIAKKLGIHWQTVKKYAEMSEEEFCASQSYERKYWHKLDDYESFVVAELREMPFLSAPQIHDHLKAEYKTELPVVSERTVFNFVERIRKSYDIPKREEESRPYEKLPETEFGEYAQADFGERWQKDRDGKSVKVYFFAMSLSRSRHKFVFFSKRPFTTALAIYAHELAFEFYGGVPKKIVYDQDRLFIVNENLGDYILTGAFRRFATDCGFEPVFCRKSDPQSKGKIENFVKYIKYNFLRGRVFIDIDTLNREAIEWLERTANGTEHHGIRRIPAELFKEEKEHLLPYNGVPTPPVEDVRQYHVHKDNVINYHGNYYTVPTGTYRGRDTMVYVVEKDGWLTIFSVETGKTVSTHKVSGDKGRLIRDRSHQRDRQQSIDDYEAQIKSLLPKDQTVTLYLAELRKDKHRHYRDNLKFLGQLVRYSDTTIIEAMAQCRESKVYNGQSVMSVAENIRILKKEALKEDKPVMVSPDCIPNIDATPEKTDINSFNHLFQ